MLRQDAAIAANRFGLGARPGDGPAIGSDARGWLLAQLEPIPVGVTTGQPRSARVLSELDTLRSARRSASPGNLTQPRDELVSFIRARYLEQAAERHALAIASDRSFAERLVHFWSNHFAVSADKQPIAALAGLHEQEAIRPHVNGSFYDLLLAAERHPAMILYLDNQASMGAGSAAARFGAKRGRQLGLNENLAREILELHTLGADGGYTQADVTELARVLTGWSIGGTLGERFYLASGANADGGRPGGFQFRERMHEPGDKTILGTRYREQGVAEGEAVLRALALHPNTARHLATKLVRHFVADEPPRALVERLAGVYLEHEGDLGSVYRALIEADESWRDPPTKFKTPHDFVISAYRSLGTASDDLRPLTTFLTQAGQRPYTPGSPAGWPDAESSWNGGDALLKRIEFATIAGNRIGDGIDPVARADEVLGALGEHTAMSLRSAESRRQGVALLLAAPEFQRR